MTLAEMMSMAQHDVSLDEVKDVIDVMRRQESTTYLRRDYLAECATLAEKVVDGSWRQRIVEWMYGVVDHCAIRRDSVAIAAYYLDLCVERGIIASRQEFQLAAMTALQLAIKLFDSTMVKLDSMVKLGRGLFTEQDVIAMEQRMLAALKWQVHPPTPVCYLRQYLRLLPESVSPLTRYMMAEVTRFISEISVCLYKFVKHPPSVVAYAGMLIAMERIDELTLPIWQRQEIFAVMSKFGSLDCTSPLVLQTIEQLRQSLEKNINIQDLMNAIDAQCHETHGKMAQCGYGRDSANASPTSSHSSPRDVMGRRL